MSDNTLSTGYEDRLVELERRVKDEYIEMERDYPDGRSFSIDVAADLVLDLLAERRVLIRAIERATQ